MPAKSKKILIIGLGNPGKKYIFTRHNFGFRVVERLRETLALENFAYKPKLLSQVSAGTAQDINLILALPQTFMNVSGDAAYALKKKFGLTPAKILVVHDDKDLELGTIKLKEKGGSAGHKGVESIIQKIGSNNFKRLRLGIAPQIKQDVPTEKFVLSKFLPEEEPTVRNQIDKATSAIIEWLGLEEQ